MKRESETIYAKTLLELASKKSEQDAKRVADSFFSLLQKKGVGIAGMRRIVVLAEALRKKRDGIAKVSITTAFAPDRETQFLLEKMAKEVFETKSVEMTFKQDDSLLGGFVMRTENEMIDASVANRLRQVRQVL